MNYRLRLAVVLAGAWAGTGTAAEPADTLDALLQGLDASRPSQERQEAAKKISRRALDKELQGRADEVVKALVTAINDPDVKVSNEATWALASVGEPAVGPFVELLGHKNTRVRQHAALKLWTLTHAHPKLVDTITEKATAKLGEMVADPEGAVRHNATYALSELGPEAIPHLIKVLPDEKLGWSVAAKGIARHGEKAVPALLPCLASKDATTVRNAAQAVAQMGPRGKDAVPALVALLRTDDPDRWHAGAAALGRIGPAAKPAVPLLIRLLEEPGHFSAAAGALTGIGLEANEVAPVLAALGRARLDEEKRRTAPYYLPEALATAGAEGVPELVKALRAPQTEVRLAAVLALEKLGPRAAKAEDALNAALADASIRHEAVEALLAIGASAKQALPFLMTALETDGETTLARTTEMIHRSRAATSLGRMGADALPAVLEGLQDTNRKVRLGCLIAVAANGKRAIEATPKLKKLLVESADQAEQEYAVRALQAVDPDEFWRMIGKDANTLHLRELVPKAVAAVKKQLAEQKGR
jgi:HEAT repeat protein